MVLEMGKTRTPVLKAVRAIRRIPADLTIILVFTAITCAIVLTPIFEGSAVRVLFVLGFAFFVPGYVTVAALYPERSGFRSMKRSQKIRPQGDIDGIERLALSVAASILVLSYVGMLLNFTRWGIRLEPVLLASSCYTAVGASIAAVQRWRLPPDGRFQVPFERWFRRARTDLNPLESPVTVLLVATLILSVGTVTYTATMSAGGETFTEFYLLTENETGELVANDYPREFVRGEGESVIVGIENHERQQIDYTVVVQLQRVSTENGSLQVLEAQELRRFQSTLDSGETWRHEHTVAPTMSGSRLRLEYLLFRGTAPADPTAEQAYRELHIWVNVTSPEG